MAIQIDGQTRRARPAVLRAVDTWHLRKQVSENAPVNKSAYPAAETILERIPSREQLFNLDEAQLDLPFYEAEVAKTTVFYSLGRLATWLNVVFRMFFGSLFDRLLRRDTDERRAVRLRKELEHAGGTFVKLGQQAAMRIDLLPWAYCVELSKMLDRMKPFPIEHALEAVKRATGKSWEQTFSVFDPEPIGAASIACVYQAITHQGDKVVVKVRRPRIAEIFTADLKVLDWIFDLAEFLTILRPGFTRNLRTELREILFEELDFRREARFQDTFRRNVEKSGRDFFTAPRVYFEYSSKEVLVQEFVSGLWLWEVIAIVEQKTPHGIKMLREQGIDPDIVARRILWAAFWSMDENVFFHADPHPANILVRPDNQITFIDFGSCGSFNNQQRIALEQMVLSMKNQDVETMTNGSLSLMEPLPPVDLPALVKHAQSEYMHVLHTFNTPAKYTEYWERTSARQWLALIRVARKFNLPLNLHMLRMIRATLLYDSIVLRLDNQLDRYYEYRLFMKDRANMVKKKWRSRLRHNAGDGFFLRLEELGESLNDLLITTQTTLGRPVVRLGSTVDKWIFSASVFSRMGGRVILVTIAAMLAAQLVLYFNGEPISFAIVLGVVLRNILYRLFLIATVVFNIRHILFRLQERDVGAGR